MLCGSFSTGSGRDGGSKEVPEGVRVGRCI